MRRAVAVWLAGILMVPVTGTAAAPAASTADRAERPRIHVGPVREVFHGSRRASARWLVAAMGQDNVATVGFTTARFSTNSWTEGFFTADVPGPAGLSPIVGDDPRLFLAEDDPPQLAADQAGNMTALWEQTAHDPDTGAVDFREIMTAYRPVGGEWSAPFAISEGIRYGGVPQLAVSSNGAAIVVFTGRRNLVSVYRPPGATEWGRPELGPGIRRSDPPSVSIDSRGRALVVFQRGRSIVANRRHPEHGWGHEQVLQRANPIVAHPAAVANERGAAVANWLRLLPIDGSDHLFRYEFHFARMSPKGQWRSQDVTIPFGDTFDLGHDLAQRPKTLAMDRRGRAIFVWAKRRSTVWVMRSTAHGRWKAPRRLAVDAHLDHTHSDPSNWPQPRVAVGRHGETLVVWKSRRPGQGILLEGRYLLDGTWTKRRALTPPGPRLREYAFVLGTPGRGVIAWHRNYVRARSLSVH